MRPGVITISDIFAFMLRAAYNMAATTREHDVPNV